MIKLIYVAGPYRGACRATVLRNIDRAEYVAMEVARLGAMPVATHSLTRNIGDAQSEDFWVLATLECMRRCDAVVLVPGWEGSAGTAGEIAEAARLGIPVFTFISDLAQWLQVDYAERGISR